MRRDRRTVRKSFRGKGYDGYFGRGRSGLSRRRLRVRAPSSSLEATPREAEGCSFPKDVRFRTPPRIPFM